MKERHRHWQQYYRSAWTFKDQDRGGEGPTPKKGMRQQMKVMRTTYKVVTQSRPNTFLDDQMGALLSRTLMYTYSNVGRE